MFTFFCEMLIGIAQDAKKRIAISIGNRMNASALRDIWARVMF